MAWKGSTVKWSHSNQMFLFRIANDVLIQMFVFRNFIINFFNNDVNSFNLYQKFLKSDFHYSISFIDIFTDNCLEIFSNSNLPILNGFSFHKLIEFFFLSWRHHHHHFDLFIYLFFKASKIRRCVFDEVQSTTYIHFGCIEHDDNDYMHLWCISIQNSSI